MQISASSREMVECGAYPDLGVLSVLLPRDLCVCPISALPPAPQQTLPRCFKQGSSPGGGFHPPHACPVVTSALGGRPYLVQGTGLARGFTDDWDNLWGGGFGSCNRCRPLERPSERSVGSEHLAPTSLLPSQVPASCSSPSVTPSPHPSSANLCPPPACTS